MKLSALSTFIFFTLTSLTKSVTITQSGLKIRDYAPQLLDIFIQNSTTVQKILSHGCHCARLDKTNPYLQYLGGPDSVDELDEICRNWQKCRSCNDRLDGGTCNVVNSNAVYMLNEGSYHFNFNETNFESKFLAQCDQVLNTVINDDSQSNCNQDTCLIDLEFVPAY